MSRIFALLLPAVLVSAGVAFPTTAVDQGGRTLEGWWLAALGVASIPVLLVRGGLRKPARLASVFLLGFAGQLALTQPHWLQYLRLHPREYGGWVDSLAPAAVALQACVVLWLCGPGVRGLLAFARSEMSAARWLLATACFLACAVHYSLRVDGFMGTPRLLAQLVATGALFALNLLHLVLIARALPSETCDRGLRAVRARVTLPGEAREPTRLDRRMPWLLALWTLLLTIALSSLGYGRTPHIPDELGYLFNAHYLAAGLLSAPAPPVPEAFDLYLLTVFEGKWYCAMSPGWPLVLALGSLLGVEWLVNPILTACCIPLVWEITRRLLDRGHAHAVALLFTASPWFLFLGASFMTHIWTLLLTLCGWCLVLRARDSRPILHALLAGLCIGALFAVRSLDCLIVAAVTGMWCLGLWKGPRLRLSALAAYAVGGIAAACAVLLYNAHLTGSAFTLPLNHYYDQVWYPGANRLGFGADIANHSASIHAACPPAGGWGALDPLPGHGWADVLLNTNQNLYNLNFELFGWGTGSVLLAVVHLLWGKFRAADRFFLLLALLLGAGYSFFWFSGGPDFGARYWFTMIYPVIWFTVRGAGTLSARLARMTPSGSRVNARIFAVIGLMSAATLLLFLPWRCTSRYVDYRGANPDYQQWLDDGTFDGALVLVKSASPLDWGNALILNRPTLDGPGPVFAHDLGPETNRRLIEAFPDRPVFWVEGRSVTGGESRIIVRTGPDR